MKIWKMCLNLMNSVWIVKSVRSLIISAAEYNSLSRPTVSDQILCKENNEMPASYERLFGGV